MTFTGIKNASQTFSLLNFSSVLISRLISCFFWSRGQRKNLFFINLPRGGISGIFTIWTQDPRYLLYFQPSQAHNPFSVSDSWLLDSYGKLEQRREGNAPSAWANTIRKWTEKYELWGTLNKHIKTHLREGKIWHSWSFCEF